MARGFNYAPGASAEVTQAREVDLSAVQVNEMASSRNPLVREEIARRQDLPLATVVTLAHDRVTDVRAALAANATASPSVLEHLAGDKHVEVLLALLTNPRLDAALVEKLAFHKRSEVREQATRRMLTQAVGGEQVDQATPELRDRVVLNFPDGAPLTGTTGVSLHGGNDHLLGPVRGFRPPAEG